METLINLILLNWLQIISAIAGAIGFFLVSRWKNLSLERRLTAFVAIVLVLHVLEEWVTPGGFHYLFNLLSGSHDPSGYPMSRLTDMITNFGAVLVITIVLWKWSETPQTILALAIFSLTELLGHLYMAFASFELFKDAGLSFPYSPGLITTLFGFLPIGIFCIVALVKSKSLTVKKVGISILAAVVLTFSLIIIPEHLLKDPNTPYKYPTNGFYDQFLSKE